MGEAGIDIQLSSEARKVFPWAVECKNVARIAIYSWWEQATAAAKKEDLEPLLVVKANLKQPLVCMTIPAFMKLQEKVHETTQSIEH